MRSIRMSGLTVFTSALALVVAAIPVSGLASGPVAQGPTATTVHAASPGGLSAGTLELSTTSGSGIVEWEGQRQEFWESSQCQIVQAEGAPELLRLEGVVGTTTGTAGFRNGNIGVYEFDSEGDGASNAAQCFRVDAGSFSTTETLSLTLGEDASEDDFGPVVARGISVSAVAQSRNGSVQVTLVQADGETQTLEPVRWNGRQNGAAISVGGPFTGSFIGIQLKAVSGSFSVRGATFDLVSGADGVLDCEDSATLEATATGPEVTVTRLDNADAGEPCVPVLYTLRNADQAAQFLKPLDEQISAQFILDIVWTVSPANTGDVTQPLLPETEMDYEVGEVAPITLRWCPDVMTDEDDNPVGIVDVRNNLAAVDQVPDGVLEGKQFTCILSQNARVVDGDPDYITFAQQIYLLGDAKMSLK